jgi:hypothetical protein
VAASSAVVVINVSNPSSPFIVTSLSMGATDVAVSGSRLYVIGTQLNIVDVTNPAAPVLLSTSNSYGAQGVDVSGALVFLAKPATDHTDTTGGVYIIDVTNATQPTLIDQIVVPGTTRSVTNRNGYIHAGDSAAIVDVISLTP